MAWQDFVFLAGSLLSVVFLAPTLRDAAARVPRATSVPSMVIGGVYSLTFLTLDMTFSAFGAFAACTMWSLIVWFRGPDEATSESIRNRYRGRQWWLVADDCYRWLHRLAGSRRSAENRYLESIEH